MRRSAELSVKETAAAALWTVAAADVEERQRVAELMGASTFTQFLDGGSVVGLAGSGTSDELLAIGAEGIEVDNKHYSAL